MNGGPWLVGVDGCKGGWIAVFMQPRGRAAHIKIVKRFAALHALQPAIVAVDMPIGLPLRSEVRGRSPERIIRKLVGKRASSIFRVPSRAAIYASADRSICSDTRRFERAREIARNTSEDNKAFAKQGFYLCAQIVEVDRVLRQRRELITRTFEIHPELAFWSLNGRRALVQPKTTREGICERRKILMRNGASRDLVFSRPPRGAAVDDLLDATACALIARKIHHGTATCWPPQPRRDPCGLPMAIWA